MLTVADTAGMERKATSGSGAAATTTVQPESPLESSLQDLSIKDNNINNNTEDKKNSLRDVPKLVTTAGATTTVKTPTKPGTEKDNKNKNKKEDVKTKTAPIAESWEDEIDSSSDDDEDKAATKDYNKNNSNNNNNSDGVDTNTPISPAVVPDGIREPPPTPISPLISSQTFAYPDIPTYSAYGSPTSNSSRSSPFSGGGGSSKSSTSFERRPEKQTAVAGRLIAGALGVRAPKRTEEERAYERAVKEQEIKRRNREKEREAREREEEERVKASIWNE